jgi:excisionase family DNA binding protein
MADAATQLDLSDTGFVTTREAAEILGTSVTYVWQLTKKGWLKPYKIGTGSSMRLSLYRKSDVEAYRDTHPRLGTRSALT